VVEYLADLLWSGLAPLAPAGRVHPAEPPDR